MIAFIYPGQGSQAPGMGQFLYNEFPLAKQTFEEASDALSLDIKKLCFLGTPEELAKTENTQPALLTVSTATARVLESELGLLPMMAAGHSVGEYAALVHSHVLSLSDAVKAVRYRGQVMQEAVPLGAGGMAAVMGVDATEAQIICESINQQANKIVLQVANFNSLGQIVMSGSSEGISRLKEAKFSEIFKAEKKVKIIPLNVSAPFHCFLMKPAEEKMAALLKKYEFKSPRHTIVQNRTALPGETPETLQLNLIEQVSGSVLWMQSISLMSQKNVTQFIEVGHGKVLSGLNKKNAPDITTLSTQSVEDIKAIEAVLKASSQIN